MIRSFLPSLLALIVVACAAGAAAHETRPVFLDLRETAPGLYAGTWKRPVFGQHAVRVEPRFEAGCRIQPGARIDRAADSVTERFVLRCPTTIAGSRITLAGLSSLMIDGLVRVELLSGQTSTAVVRPQNPVWRAPASMTALDVFGDYLRLGVEHILFGWDHLLFVFGLVLLVRDARRLLITATAFTLAHSITLSAAALGVVRLPVPPVEALIALSILFVALEVIRSQREPHLARGVRPATLAFGFGLLHGFGFASALARIGLPQHEIPAALLAFNLGVEVGQVAFILTLLGVARLATRLDVRRRNEAVTAGAYLVGSLAVFLTLQRISAFG